MSLSFSITHRSRSCPGRVGRVETPHGGFDTPAFMPVGTRGTVKGVTPQQVADTGAQILLNNTYHLLLRPGPELVERQGGVHAFMGWDRPILTDSGGYQAFSMADMNAIDEDGVTFKSIIDGSDVRMTPESATRVQNQLGADVIMAFDDCPPAEDPLAGPPNLVRVKHQQMWSKLKRRGYDHGRRLDEANERTVRWLERCKRAHARPGDQALFGIVQGGTDLDRRAWSIERVCDIDLPGYAIGGVAVGEAPEQIAEVARFAAPRMPESKPRYLMGVGYERDLTAAALAGVDMFDCVLPTRNGRNSYAFTRSGQLRLKNAKHAEDPGPIEPGCDCVACDPGAHGWRTPDARPFGRAYLRHLFVSGEMLGPILLSLHNLRHFQRLMLDIRAALVDDDWPGFVERWPIARPGVPERLLSSPTAPESTQEQHP